MARQESHKPAFETGNLRVDLANRQILVNAAKLTPLNYKLFNEFAKYIGEVIMYYIR